MTSRTAWTAGNGVGFTWTLAINTADLTTMATANTVVSSVADIANQTNLDMFMDISVSCNISSSTIAAGANLALFIFPLNQDGTTYGDGQFTNGTAAAKTPTFPPCGVIPLVAAASQTTLLGMITQIPIPPGSFRVGMQNNSGFTFTGTNTVKYRTYNLNLNN